MNKNAPFIREIIYRTDPIKGVKVQGNNGKEIKISVQNIIQNQLQQAVKQQNARTQTY